MNTLFLILNIFAPLLAAVGLFCLNKFTGFKNLKTIIKQIIIGIVFGGIAILCNECAFAYNGGVVTATNASIVLSGLIFGGPAALISGGITAIEILISLVWKSSQFTLIASFIGALFAGAFSFVTVKFFFKNKRPNFLFGLAITLVSEAFALLMVLLTHVSNSGEALTYISKIIVLQLIIPSCVGLVGILSVDLVEFKEFVSKFKTKQELPFKVQNLMLAVVAILFAATSGAIYGIQSNSSNVETNRLLSDGINIPKQDVKDRINESHDFAMTLSSIRMEEAKDDPALRTQQEREFDPSFPEVTTRDIYLERCNTLLDQLRNYYVSFVQIFDDNRNEIATYTNNDVFINICNEYNLSTLLIPENLNLKNTSGINDPSGYFALINNYIDTAAYNEDEGMFTFMPITNDFINLPFKYNQESPFYTEDKPEMKVCATSFYHNGPDSEPKNSRKYTVVVGYNKTDYSYLAEESYTNITANTHVGKVGVSIILQSDYDQLEKKYSYRTLSAPAGYSGYYFDEENNEMQPYFKDLITNLSNIDSQSTNAKFEFPLRNEKGFAMYSKEANIAFDNAYLYYISIVSQAEMAETRDNSIAINTLLQIMVFAVLFGFIYFVINKAVVKPIDSMKKSLNTIAEGNLDEVVDVNESAEFVELSTDVNNTVGVLKGFIEKEKNRLAEDLALAKSIQKNALPSVYPNDPRITMAASMNTAKEVGGDFYDFYMPKQDQVNILIADVSGKGVPAAMFMMRAKTQLKSLNEAGRTIDDSFNEANVALCNGNQAGMFVTTWQGNIDLNTGLMKYVNAGHNPPVIKHKNGKFEFLKSNVGLVLAGLEFFKYSHQELQLKKGDTVFLYTDGITEANNLTRELYGDDRLLNLLNSLEGDDLKPENILKHVLDDVTKFAGEAPQFDDETMVCFIYNGK